MEILDQGSQSTARYILDLYRSTGSERLYRSKIMIVGYEGVGKTTLLDTLFPFEGVLKTKKGRDQKKSRYLLLQGPCLSLFQQPQDKPQARKLDQVIKFGPGGYVLEAIQKDFKFVLSPPSGSASPQWKLYAESEATFGKWRAQLIRASKNTATHGIEIKKATVTHPYVENQLAGKGSLQVSIWDFAGQHEFYNTHHHFLNKRTVFLVLWNMKKGAQGLESLRFWLNSLAIHLGRGPAPGSGDDRTDFSIFIVGTHQDCAMEIEDKSTKIAMIIEELGLGRVPIQCFEVSCATLENIALLQRAIFESMLSHSYMGETISTTYLIVQQTIEEIRLESTSELQMPTLLHVLNHCQRRVKIQEDTLKRALSLFSLWGECVYFPDHPELASIVFLDPSFLAKAVLGNLFNPASKQFFPDGIIQHGDLRQIWMQFSKLKGKGFWTFAARLMAVMEKFEVSFPLQRDPSVPFEERSSLITSFLPDTLPPEKRRDHWPIDPPSNLKVEVERAVFFNVLPEELVSRLLVRLQSLIQENLVSRRNLILRDRNGNLANLEISVENNSLCATLRGEKLESCEALMKQIIYEIDYTCKNYSGVARWESVRSPFSQTAQIPMDEILRDQKLPIEDRTLQCPDTHFPLSPDYLLHLAGHQALPPNQGSLCPFVLCLIPIFRFS